MLQLDNYLINSWRLVLLLTMLSYKASPHSQRPRFPTHHRPPSCPSTAAKASRAAPRGLQTCCLPNREPRLCLLECPRPSNCNRLWLRQWRVTEATTSTRMRTRPLPQQLSIIITLLSIHRQSSQTFPIISRLLSLPTPAFLVPGRNGSSQGPFSSGRQRQSSSLASFQ